MDSKLAIGSMTRDTALVVLKPEIKKKTLS